MINSEYEFLLVVAGVSVDDDAVTTIADGFDGLLSWHRGLHRLAVSSEGADAVDAFQDLLPRIVSAVPALRILRLDPDLVGVSDIAERSGHSRQNVQQWVSGERNGDRPFPPPEGSAGRSLVWRWAEVNAWLKPLGLDDQATRPTREESALLDVALIQWNQAPVGVLSLGSAVNASSRLAATDSSAQGVGGATSSVALRTSGHETLLARIPIVTGRDLREWFRRLESGPAFLRADERAHWLADEHGLTHGYASAIVHEYEIQRRSRMGSA